jgi:four helix bundle protein
MESGYRSLVVWQRSRALAIQVYGETKSGPLAADWDLRDQMRRAAVSVPSNIAEGAARGSNPDCVRFLWFAKGSLAELATQADIAEGVGLLDSATSQAWQAECARLAAMLKCLIAARTSRRAATR